MDKPALLIIDAQQEYFAPIGKVVLPDGNLNRFLAEVKRSDEVIRP
jgi:nicotinamidase-related amidase